MKSFIYKMIFGFIGFLVMVTFATSVAKGIGSDGPVIGFILMIVVAVGIFVFVSYGPKKTKEAKNFLVNNISDLYQTIKNKNDIKKAKREYREYKHRCRYMSDNKVKRIYDEIKGDDEYNLKRLAIEEELVDRDILEYSPMHNKFESIINKLS